MSRPVKTYSSGNARLSIWKNDQYGTFSFSLQKSYKDKSGEWKNTNYFSITDLMNVISLCWKVVLNGIKDQTSKQPNQATDLQKPEYKQSGKQFLDKHREDQEDNLHFDPEEDQKIPF